jgi:hypothetical protein
VIPLERVEASARRVLTLKAELGLLQHKQASLQVTRSL